MKIVIPLLAAAALTLSAPGLAKPKGKRGLPAAASDVSTVKPTAPSSSDPATAVAPPDPCAQPPGGEAASDWRPPPIPPKEARGPAPQGGKAAADWRPPPIPPRDPNAPTCNPQAADSADWRPPPIPPKR